MSNYINSSQVLEISELLFNKNLPNGVERVLVDVIKRKNGYSISDLIFVVKDESGLLELVEGQDNTKYYLRFDLLKTKWVMIYEDLAQKYLGMEIYPNYHIGVMKKSIYESTYRYSR